MSEDDSALIERANRGDRQAFGALVKKYQRRVYATAFQLLGQHSDADDVAQEAFVRAYRGLAGFDGRADFFTWMYRIVVNVALNHLRSRKRQRLESGLDETATQVEAPRPTDPRAASESREVMAAVVRALGELSPTLRVTLIMATIEDIPYKSIAQTLGIPEGTVAWRVNQARKLLRQRLGALLPEVQGNETDDVLRRTKEALGVS